MILIFLFFVTVFLHLFFKVRLFKNNRHFFRVYFLVLVIGTIWDNFAIARGHWVFGEKFLFGPHIGLMPVEEYGFIMIVSYFGLVIYKIVEKYSK